MSEAGDEGQVARVTRIDTAHSLGTESDLVPGPVAESSVAAAAGIAVTQVGQQLRSQAGQIARHLRAKQQQLDRREALINARVAQLEREVRASRLNDRERAQVAARREQELNDHIRELQRQLSAVTAAEYSGETRLRQRTLELDKRQAELEARELRANAGQSLTVEECETLRQAKDQFHTSRQRQERQLAEREEQLSRTASLLDEQARTIQERQCALQREAQASETRIRQERESIEREKHDATRRLDKTREELASWHERLVRRETALELLKQQILEAHRDALELRLVTEQLWQQKASEGFTAERAKTLGELRGKLAEDWAQERRESDEKARELHDVASLLASRQRHLSQYRAELKAWLARQQAALEEQAAKLVKRERELEAERTELSSRESQWHRERADLQAEIRRLLTLPEAA